MPNQGTIVRRRGIALALSAACLAGGVSTGVQAQTAAQTPGFAAAERGYREYGAKNFEQSTLSAREAIAAQPNNLGYRLLLVDSLLSSGNVEAAESALNAIPPQVAASDSSAVTNRRDGIVFARADAGYAALRDKDDKRALASFELAIEAAKQPGATRIKTTVLLDAGYAARRIGNRPKAERYFREALAAPDVNTVITADRQMDLKRELTILEKKWGGNALLSYGPVGLAVGGLPSASGSRRNVTQAGGELWVRPDFLQPSTGGGIELFGRYFETLNDAPGAPTGGDTGQGAAGVRWRPFVDTNLVLEAGRLIKIGNVSRNDTQLRIAYSLDHGTSAPATGEAAGAATSGWPAWRVYAEANRFTETNLTVALAQGEYGRAYRVGSADSRMVLFPHVLLAASYDNSYAQASAYSTGVGVTQRIPLGAEWGVSYIDLTLQYRVRLGGDADRARGWFATASVNF